MSVHWFNEDVGPNLRKVQLNLKDKNVFISFSRKQLNILKLVNFP